MRGIGHPTSSNPGSNPLRQRHTRNKSNHILDIPDVAVVGDKTLLVERECGNDVELEMKRRRDRHRCSRNGNRRKDERVVALRASARCGSSKVTFAVDRGKQEDVKSVFHDHFMVAVENGLVVEDVDDI